METHQTKVSRVGREEETEWTAGSYYVQRDEEGRLYRRNIRQEGEILRHQEEGQRREDSASQNQVTWRLEGDREEKKDNGASGRVTKTAGGTEESQRATINEEQEIEYHIEIEGEIVTPKGGRKDERNQQSVHYRKEERKAQWNIREEETAARKREREITGEGAEDQGGRIKQKKNGEDPIIREDVGCCQVQRKNETNLTGKKGSEKRKSLQKHRSFLGLIKDNLLA